MKNKLLFFLIVVLIPISILSQESNFEFSASSNLGLTFTSMSKEETNENLEWLLNLQVILKYHSDNFHFDSDCFINYGQIVRTGYTPLKSQDLLIFNLMPSIKLMDTPSIRLFLQTKAETQLKRGYIGEQETNFLDPLFLTNTIFIGEKNNLIKYTDDQKLELIYGIGYSFQQVIKKHFVLTSEDFPSSDVEYINSPSAVFKVEFNKTFSEDVSFSASINSLFTMKKDFWKSTSNSRFSSLFLARLDIAFLSLQYVNRFVFDKEISKKRIIEQSLVLGLPISI
ncbi:MAG: DUF3078 domain-containing protein [Bacteroidota bacterium]|jgi:hypothetical protein